MEEVGSEYLELKYGIDGFDGDVQIFDSKSTKSLKITDLTPGLMNKKYDKVTKDSRDKKRCKSKNADGKK